MFLDEDTFQRDHLALANDPDFPLTDTQFLMHLAGR